MLEESKKAIRRPHRAPRPEDPITPERVERIMPLAAQIVLQDERFAGLYARLETILADAKKNAALLERARAVIAKSAA